MTPAVGLTRPSSGVRADLWLCAARLFKTRRLCREAIDGGKIDVNGARCKPARQIKSGDCLRVTRGDECIVLEVLALADKRGPASAARALYRESDASIVARESRREQTRMQGSPGPKRRPDKAVRRHLRRLKHGG